MGPSSQRFCGFEIQGLVSAPCTPYDANGDLNLAMIEPYVAHLQEFGIPNVFVTGSCGEGLNMTLTERKLVVEEWMKHSKGKLSAVIVHIGAGCLRDTQELARHAESVGAHALGCVAPTYFKPQSLECYVEYMAQVAAAAPKTPFYVYDIKELTGIPYSTPAFFREAAERIPSLTGVKHTTPDLPSMMALMSEFDGRFQVILGSDELYLSGLALGVKTTVMTSFFGHILNRLRAAFDRGDIDTARLEQARIVKLGGIRDRHGLWGPASTKGALRMLGMDVGQPRLPLAEIDEAVLRAYEQDMRDAGYFDWGLTA